MKGKGQTGAGVSIDRTVHHWLSMSSFYSVNCLCSSQQHCHVYTWPQWDQRQSQTTFTLWADTDTSRDWILHKL